MARYPLGQPVRISVAVTSLDSGAATDAATISLTVQHPDMTRQTYAAPVRDGLGEYHVDIPAADLATAGHYQWAWTVTGASSPVVAGQPFGDFDVFDPFEPAVLSLADAKTALRIPAADTSKDDEVAAYLATVESNFERMTGGPIVNRNVTERVEAEDGLTVLVVRQRPLVSLVSVISQSGDAMPTDDMTDLDPNAGTIRRRLGLPFYGPFFAWIPIFTVTYVAGWGTAAPAAFSTAARLIIKHLWQAERGAMPLAVTGGDETVTLPGWGFAIPNRAAELLAGAQNGMPFMSEAYI